VTGTWGNFLIEEGFELMASKSTISALNAFSTTRNCECTAGERRHTLQPPVVAGCAFIGTRGRRIDRIIGAYD